MTDDHDDNPAPLPTLEEMRHWTHVMGRAQQRMMEHMARHGGDPGAALAGMWRQGLSIWGLGGADPRRQDAERDRRFDAPEWRDDPLFDLIRRSYLLISDRLLAGIEAIEGLDEAQRAQLRFASRAFLDAMSPANFALTNPEVLERALETRGESLLRGLDHMLRDMARGQLTHSPPDAFLLGRDIATTPGKVVKQTPLYQLVQYAPATSKVREVPLVIFPPWINRFYILDLNEKKSFVRWAVGRELTVFIVSWKSADESLRDVTMDDYVRAQRDAIDTVRGLLDVDHIHAVGYCVAGTTLAATLALLAARGEADKVASATFLTAQVDFSEAGDLRLFTGDAQLRLIAGLSAEKGYLDGRYMAATFNLLRGRDLIWNYAVDHYLLGKEHAPFDLLHWNGDTTNLPAKWHLAYLGDLYRDNKLAQPGGIVIEGTPIDLGRVRTPSYVQAGREDHIAPARSVWKITRHFRGPVRFVLAGSGHIAGVVNPPEAGKYQYWVNEAKADTLDAFIAGAKEVKGSWWPDWLRWIGRRSGGALPATGARIPGAGALAAIEDAPGSYVRAR